LRSEMNLKTSEIVNGASKVELNYFAKVENILNEILREQKKQNREYETISSTITAEIASKTSEMTNKIIEVKSKNFRKTEELLGDILRELRQRD
jgi:hypothetical protein